MDEMTGITGARVETSSPPGPSHVALQAKLFSGLADPRRLALLRVLVSGPHSAGELARSVGLSASGASNHLRCLLECGLVIVESDGRFNRYRLADVGVAGLLLGADQLLGRLAAEIAACVNYGAPSRRALRTQTAPPRSGGLRTRRSARAQAPARGQARAEHKERVTR